MIFTRRGQSVLEYTIIVGIVVVLLTYMGTSIKRGVQSLVKVAADQVGDQSNADQDFNDAQQGYMIASNTVMSDTNNKQVTETGYIPQSGNAFYRTQTNFDETTYTMTNSITNGGFSPSS
jgi:predicted PurR-regulated permease PerM